MLRSFERECGEQGFFLGCETCGTTIGGVDSAALVLDAIRLGYQISATPHVMATCPRCQQRMMEAVQAAAPAARRVAAKRPVLRLV